MNAQMPCFDCGDCPLYGGCLNVCARSLWKEVPKEPAKDLFEAAAVGSDDDLAPRCRRSSHQRPVAELPARTRS